MSFKLKKIYIFFLKLNLRIKNTDSIILNQRFLRFDFFNSSIPHHSSSEHNLIRFNIQTSKITTPATYSLITKNEQKCLPVLQQPLYSNGLAGEFGGAVTETGVVSRRAPQRHASSTNTVVTNLGAVGPSMK